MHLNLRAKISQEFVLLFKKQFSRSNADYTVIYIFQERKSPKQWIFVCLAYNKRQYLLKLKFLALEHFPVKF